MRWWFFALLLCWQLEAANVLQLRFDGIVAPAYSDYLKQGVEEAKAKDAKLILLLMDTPGGLMSSMRSMIQTIANSPIPIATYVYPIGAQAASAGTYLLYASHIAAMSPGTNLGAATPVQMGGKNPFGGDQNSSLAPAMERKVINDATAMIKSLAQLHDRNISWALEAVKEGKSLSASEALENRVIDFLADTPKELLDKLHGHKVMLSDKAVTLDTENARMIVFDPDWKTELLSIITKPDVAYIFLLIAMYGIFFELMNPGSFIPGTIGAISGIIALYALDVLPFSYAGLALILLGVSLMIAEVMIAGFGILGVGGAIAFAFGSLLLFDAETLGDQVSIPLIVAFTLASLGFFFYTMRLYFKNRKERYHTGREEMIGMEAEITHLHDHGYTVWCHGESWQAKSDISFNVGDRAVVSKLEGLTLTLQPKKKD